MKPYLVKDLPPGTPEHEQHALSSRHATTDVYEEACHSLATAQALLDLGREIIAKMGGRTGRG